MVKVLVAEVDSSHHQDIRSCLLENGFDVQTGRNALDCLRISHEFHPDVLVAEWMLKDGTVATELLKSIRTTTPAIRGILVSQLLNEPTVYADHFVFDSILYKPLPPTQIVDAVRHVVGRLSNGTEEVRDSVDRPEDALVYVVDDDPGYCRLLEILLSRANLTVECKSSSQEFLASYDDSVSRPCCLVLDERMPEMNGLDLLHSLREAGAIIPVILMTAYADTALVVNAMRHGALDVMEKPGTQSELVSRVREAIKLSALQKAERNRRDGLQKTLNDLTKRQLQVFELLVAANNAKQIAAHLHINFKTVSKHRAALFRKLGVRNEVELVRLVSSARQ